MADRYANAAGSNTAPYDTWAKGATDPQTIADLAVAGDTNYYGDFTLTSTLVLNVNVGSLAAGFIKHVGVNSSGVEDGTCAVLDGNSVATFCIQLTKQYHMISNFDLKGAVNHGFTDAAGGYNKILKNVTSQNNGGAGFFLNYSHGEVSKCTATNNTTYGFQNCWENHLELCTASFNGNTGFYNQRDTMFYGCESYYNNNYQFYTTIGGAIVNCIADGWTGSAASNTGIGVAGTHNSIAQTRVTHCATGINVSSGWATYRSAGFYGNTSDTVVGASAILQDCGENKVMLSHGYVNLNARNYSTSDSAELRNVPSNVGKS